MAELFGLTSFTGSIEVTSTEPIVSLSLNFEAAPVFSSLPPGELDASAQGSTTYYFPHLAVGASWQTTITYINYSPEEVTCQTDFISDHGTPLMVSFAALGTVVSRNRRSAARGVRSPGDQRGPERFSCARLGAGHLLRAGAGQPSVSSAQQRRGAHGEKPESMQRQFRPPALSPLPSREKVSLGPELPMQTLPPTYRSLSPLLPGTRLGRCWPASFGHCHPEVMMRTAWRSCLVSPALPDRSKSPPRSPSSVCRLNFEAAPVFSSLPPGELDASAQ